MSLAMSSARGQRWGREVRPCPRARGGRVKLDGYVWSARSFDTARAIKPGHSVTVVEIAGAVFVTKHAVTSRAPARRLPEETWRCYRHPAAKDDL